MNAFLDVLSVCFCFPLKILAVNERHITRMQYTYVYINNIWYACIQVSDVVCVFVDIISGITVYKISHIWFGWKVWLHPSKENGKLSIGVFQTDTVSILKSSIQKKVHNKDECKVVSIDKLILGLKFLRPTWTLDVIPSYPLFLLQKCLQYPYCLYTQTFSVGQVDMISGRSM